MRLLIACEFSGTVREAFRARGHDAYQFGHDASKSTCLWLKGLPLLQNTQHVPPRAVCSACGFCERAAVEVRERMFSHGCPECGAEAAKIRPRWANQTDSGQNKLSPSADRWAVRSATYRGSDGRAMGITGRNAFGRPGVTRPLRSP